MQEKLENLFSKFSSSLVAGGYKVFIKWGLIPFYLSFSIMLNPLIVQKVVFCAIFDHTVRCTSAATAWEMLSNGLFGLFVPTATMPW